MELLQGNLLIYLTMLSVILFAVIYSHLDKGNFRRIFSYYRKDNAKYECRCLGISVVSIGLGCIMIYYGLCYVLKMPGVGIWAAAFVLLTLLTCYFVITLRFMSVGFALAVSGCILCAPFVIIIVILMKGIQFDVYCGWAVPFLLGADIYLGKKKAEYWKKGDL